MFSQKREAESESLKSGTENEASLKFYLRLVFLISIDVSVLFSDEKRTFIVLLVMFGTVCGFDLHCEFSDTGWFGVINKTGCFIENLNVTTRDQTIKSVNRESLDSFNGSLVTEIVINNVKMNFIPQSLGKLFPNVETFAIFHSTLKEVQKKDLAQFSKLKFVSFPGNDLKFLPGDLFEENPEISKVIFDDNKITKVGTNLLKPLSKLNQASFLANSCIDKIADNQTELLELAAALKSSCTLNSP